MINMFRWHIPKRAPTKQIECVLDILLDIEEDKRLNKAYGLIFDSLESWEEENV